MVEGGLFGSAGPKPKNDIGVVGAAPGAGAVAKKLKAGMCGRVGGEELNSEINNKKI